MKRRLASVFPAYLAVYTLCYYVAYLLRFDFAIPEQLTARFIQTLPIVLLLKVTANLVTGEWRREFRYTGITDIFNVFMGASLTSLLVYSSNFFVLAAAPVPRSIILIDWTLTILAGGLLRMSVRLYCEQVGPLWRRESQKRTLIYGADESAIAILRTLRASCRDFKVVAFVDDSAKRIHSLIAGVPVCSTEGGWKKLAKRLRAAHVLVPSVVPGRDVRKILANCAEANLKAHVIPTVPELVDGRYQLTVRDVTISDLLRREPAQLDMGAIRNYVSNKRVLVNGAAGSIGSELCRQIMDLQPASLVLLDQSEFGIFELQQELSDLRPNVPLDFVVADVAQLQAMTRVFEEHQPELVFHAAAYKHVPLMESNVAEAVRNNVIGTKVIADLAGEYGTERFVFISTDKAVLPSNVMGATKLVAEKYVQASACEWKTQYISVRFGNVLNSAGSVVPTFRKQIAAGGPITVTHPDMERFFMTIPEAVQLVLQAGAIGSSGDVLILEMGEPVKIVDLAKDMIALSGLNYPNDINIVFTGVRPGEKLREELFYEIEKGTTKVHDMIFCASRQAPLPADIHRDLRKLTESLEHDDDGVHRVLYDIVDRYTRTDNAAPVLRKAA